MPQQGERLNLYRRIARAEDDAQITLLFEEMTDRFGRMPDEARYCLEGARIRWRGQALQLSAIGIPWLQLVDFDIVESSNLASQGYLEDDLGKLKVEATADLCMKISSSLEILFKFSYPFINLFIVVTIT